MSAKKTNKDEKLREKRILDDAFPYLEAVKNHILRVLKKIAHNNCCKEKVLKKSLFYFRALIEYPLSLSKGQRNPKKPRILGDLGVFQHPL